MIYYLDTSALVKRYVAEPGSAAVRALFTRKQVATTRIAFAELCATLARLTRERSLSERARDAIFDRLTADFSAMSIVEVRPMLLQRVPELVVRQPLRGYAAVHLAAALVVRQRGVAVEFWAADARLVEAARTEGLRTRLLA